MNTEDFKNLITKRKPRYAKSRVPIIEAFANKGNTNSEYSQFGPIYELYIYAFTLGLKKGIQLPLPKGSMTKDFYAIEKWKSGSKLVDFLLMIIFTHCKEIGFEWNELEDMEEGELNKVCDNILTFIESYANGGLEYLQQEYSDNNLINSPYLFVDLLAENSNFLEEEDETNLAIEEADEDIIASTLSLINLGESPNTEFKSTLRVNLHTGKPDDKMELACIKTIAGFMNTKKGTLLIGVKDDKEILGLNSDFKSFEEKPDLLDEFQKHLDNLVEKYIGNSAYSLLKISFPEINGKMICRIDVDFRRSGPIYVKNKSKNTEEFYIRRAASTTSLNPSEMINYIDNHWG